MRSLGVIDIREIWRDLRRASGVQGTNQKKAAETTVQQSPKRNVFLIESVSAFRTAGTYSADTNRYALVGSTRAMAFWPADNDKDMMLLRNILLNKVFDIGTEIVLSLWNELVRGPCGKFGKGLTLLS